MSVFGVKLPDVGEGVAEAELIEWYVRVGDHVTAESVLADVMTDKATVEISSPVAGVVTFVVGEPGDMLAVGTEFVGIEIEGSVPEASAPSTAAPAGDPIAPARGGDPIAPAPLAPPVAPPAVAAPVAAPSDSRAATRPTAAPAVRARAHALGIDLGTVTGTGPDGRVVHADLDRTLTGAKPTRSAPAAEPGGQHTETVIGLRRRIAERLTASWTEIPHITYVDAIDATELEALREELNRRGDGTSARLTILPFLVRAIVIACHEQPRLNAHYDSDARTLTLFDDVHVGIATQTDAGLIVPVVAHADRRGLRELADEIRTVTTAARDGSAGRDQLTGSTITITSLGAMGGLVTTPIINQPEVAIVGVNKLERRPVWRDGTFEPRLVFNLSSSFDHRIVDGWDAATFIQRVKALLEMPALLFVDDSL